MRYHTPHQKVKVRLHLLQLRTKYTSFFTESEPHRRLPREIAPAEVGSLSTNTIFRQLMAMVIEQLEAQFLLDRAAFDIALF